MEVSTRLLNKEFGILKIIEYAGVDKRHHSLWKCECNCGSSKIIRGDALISGHVKSCGCLGKLKGIDSRSWAGYKEISLTRFNKIKYDAEKRNLEFSISIEDLWNLYLKQNKKCALSGMEIFFSSKSGNASLDRIDSSKGYTIDNIQWVDKRINFMKQQYSMKEFLYLCNTISDFQKTLIIPTAKELACQVK